MQQECNANAVVMSLFLCFFKLHLFFVLDNQNPSTSSLQRDLESDEEDGAVLTAKDGTKWKKVQVDEQPTGRLASHNILKECKSSVSAPSLKLIDKPKTKNFVQQTMNCSHSLLSCTQEE